MLEKYFLINLLISFSTHQFIQKVDISLLVYNGIKVKTIQFFKTLTESILFTSLILLIIRTYKVRKRTQFSNLLIQCVA